MSASGPALERGEAARIRLAEAQLALARGWLLTPLRGKRPYLKGWQSAKPLESAEIDRLAPSNNLGLRTGSDSGIIVVDVDCDDLSIAEELGIPRTPTVKTARGRHYYLRHPGGHIKNSVSTLMAGVDVKADKGCVALPGSIHPDTGHLYAWEPGLSPDDLGFAEVPSALLAQIRPSRRRADRPDHARAPGSVSAEFAREQLRTSVATVASAGSGTRNDTLYRQAARMKQFVDAGSLSWEEVVEELAKAALLAGLPDLEVVRTLESARQSQQSSSRPGTGSPSGDGSDGGSGDDGDPDEDVRPTIVVEPGSLLVNVAAAEQALIAIPDCPIYQRGDALFRAVPDNTVLRSSRLRNAPITYTLHIVDLEWLLQECMFCARFVRPDSKDGTLRPIDCTTKIPRAYLARVGDWKMPILNAIVSTPTLRIDGSVLENPGYDAASRLLFFPGGTEYPAVPDAPTLAQARAAIGELVEPISKFPFVEAADRSVALSAMLTAVIRRSLPSAPAFAFRAPTMGSGKSLLTDVIAILMTGRVARAFTLGTQVDEEKKTIFAALLSGAPILALDNVDRAVASPVLCTILTQEVWQARVLGVSRNVTVPTDVLVILNGNNLQFEGDIITRVLPCDLDAGCERPEERSFEGDLRATVSEHRPRLVVAALTILLAYITAGRPRQALTPFGRFEAWSDLVRSALVWAGEPDPCLTRTRLRHDDPVAERLGRFLRAWHETYGSRLMVVANVAADGDKSTPSTLRDCLLEVAGDATNRINRRKLGQFLATYRNRWVDGLRLERCGKRGHAVRWKVRTRDERGDGKVEFEEFEESVSPDGESGSDSTERSNQHDSDFESSVGDSSNSSNSTFRTADSDPAENTTDPEATQ